MSLARCQTISMSCRAAWKTFVTPALAISSKKGARSRLCGQRIDSDRLVVRGELDDAELRPEGRLAQKFGIDGDEGMGRKAMADGKSSSVSR